jgi:hypothetical protein
MPTASIAVSTPRLPVIFMTASTALPSVLLMVAVAPKRLAISRRIVVEIDHDDLGRRIELRGEQRGEADRPRADDRDRASRLRPCR